MKKLLFVISLTVLVLPNSFGQKLRNTNFTTSDYWKSQKKEFFFGIGATNFLGDLGGLDRIGTDYSLVDLEWATTRPSGHIGYRYRFRPLFATKTILQYGMLMGADQLTNEPSRRYRNLNFRTHLVELSQHIEWIIFLKEHYGKRHKIRGLKGMRNKNNMVYIFSGITGFLFIPMSQDGVMLRPLNTEGQGLPGAPKPYGLFNWGIPFGMGAKIGIDQVWRISFELSYTKTFTDYLDDVSGEYYDNAAIEANYGSVAAHYADPSSGVFPGWTAEGEMRGDKRNKDAYFFFNISLVRNLQQSRRGKLKWKYKARF